MIKSNEALTCLFTELTAIFSNFLVRVSNSKIKLKSKQSNAYSKFYFIQFKWNSNEIPVKNNQNFYQSIVEYKKMKIFKIKRKQSKSKQIFSKRSKYFRNEARIF